MQPTDEFEDCIRCGVKIHRGIEVSIQTVMALSNVASEAYAQKISELEGLGLAAAQEYVDHRMGHNCTRVAPPCPSCHCPLRSWHASGCLKCGWCTPVGRALSACY